MQTIQHTEDKKNNQSYFWWFISRFKSVVNYIGELTKFVIGKVRNMFSYLGESTGLSFVAKGTWRLIDYLFVGKAKEEENAINPEDLEIDCISAIENDASRAAQRRLMKMARDLSYHVDSNGKVIMDIGLPEARSAVFEEIPKIFNAHHTRFAFFGASGSGKSALINRLSGINQDQFSAEDRAVRNTGAGAAGAAAKQLTLHKIGGLEIIDTPGYTPGSEPSKDYIGKMFSDINVNPQRLDYFDLPVIVLDAKKLNENGEFNKEDEFIIKSLLDNRFSRITVALNKVESMPGRRISQKEDQAKRAFFQKLENAGLGQYRKCFNVVCTSAETLHSSHNIEALKDEMALNAIAIRAKRFDSYVKALVSTFIKRRKKALLLADRNIRDDIVEYYKKRHTDLSVYLKDGKFISLEGMSEEEKFIFQIYRMKYDKYKADILSKHPEWNFDQMSIEELKEKCEGGLVTVSTYDYAWEKYPLEESINKYNFDDELTSLKVKACLEGIANLLSNKPHDHRRLIGSGQT